MAQQVLNGVRNFYGPRTRADGSVGTMSTVNAERQLVIVFSGDSYLNVTGKLPKGATTVGNALVEVNEVFDLGGTSPVINIGVVGAEGTNRVAQISEAQAEALGTYSIAPAGTLALNTPLAADATIGIALGGTTPTITKGGYIKVIIPYQVL